MDELKNELKKKILLIDDNEHIFASLNMAFKHRYELCYAKDGKQGCEMAAELKPDLIILDSRMPVLSGKDALFSLRAQDDKIPIIFLTAFPEDVVAQVGNLGRVSSFMVKPFDIEQLRKIVYDLLNVYT